MTLEPKEAAMKIHTFLIGSILGLAGAGVTPWLRHLRAAFRADDLI